MKVNCSIDVDHTKSKYARAYPEVFSDDIGKTVRPVCQPHRQIPFHLRAAVEKELNYLLDQDEIEPVIGRPTEWLSQIVIVKKSDGKIGICTHCHPLLAGLLKAI